MVCVSGSSSVCLAPGNTGNSRAWRGESLMVGFIYSGFLRRASCGELLVGIVGDCAGFLRRGESLAVGFIYSGFLRRASCGEVLVGMVGGCIITAGFLRRAGCGEVLVGMVGGIITAGFLRRGESLAGIAGFTLRPTKIALLGVTPVGVGSMVSVGSCS